MNACGICAANGETTELFTGHQNGSIVNWVTSKMVYTIKDAHAKGVTQVVWTSEGLLSGGVDCKLKVWRRVKDTLETAPYKILDLQGFACNHRRGISDFVIPKSLDVLPQGQILLGATSAQIFKMRPIAEWVATDSGQVDPDECVVLLLDSHYRRQDCDSLHGVATYPVCGILQGEAGGMKDTRGKNLKHYFATCGPDHTWRMWNSRTRRPEFECGVEFERPSDGLVTLCTPTCIDISPNGLMVAIGFISGGWCVYIDIGGLNGASKHVGKTTPAGTHISKGWRQIYITDTSERSARLAELDKLEKRWLATKSDAFLAQHTDASQSLKHAILDKKQEIASKNDFASSTPITVAKFAPNCCWLVIGARDGIMEIFSLKNLEVLGKRVDQWTSITSLDLDFEHMHEESFLAEEESVTRFHFKERMERAAARKVTAGEIHLNGVRGEVRKLGKCTGHGTAVTHCDWSLDCRMLRSTSDTWELLFWDAPRGTQNPRPDEFRDIVWATHTVNFGWPVQGIWPVESDGSFIHTADVSRGSGEVKVCATGDILGHIKLFRYPCVGEQAKFKSFIGHASHVKNLTFTQDNKYVISLGGHDCSVFQWRYIPKFPDILPTPKTDSDLATVVIRPSRFEVQFNRRTYTFESAVTVRLVLDGDPQEAFSRKVFFQEKLRLEISGMLNVQEDRVCVEMNLSPLIIADVTFSLSAGGSDFITAKHYALELMKIVVGAYAEGPSHKYLMLNKVSSATVLTDSQHAEKGSKTTTKVMTVDKGQVYSSDVGFCVKLATKWYDVDHPGAFGKGVLVDIARAAEKGNEKFRARTIFMMKDSEHFFVVKSVQNERDALVVDLKFMNDPDGADPGCEDLSGIVIQNLNQQTADESSMLRKGDYTKTAKNVVVSSVAVPKEWIPQRLEIERAYGYNGSQTCCNLQMLTSYVDEQVNGCMVQTDKIQLMYTAGNVVVMEDCTSGKRAVQRFFCGHEEDISCIAVHPNGFLVISADMGSEPTLKLWHSDTCAEIAEFSQSALEISPTVDDYIAMTQLASTIKALPTFGALTRERYIAAQFTVEEARDGGIVKGVFLKIDKEILCVVKVNGNQLVCKRACQGTVASRHTTGAAVHTYRPTYRHEQSGGIAAIAFTRLDYGKRIVSVSANRTHTIVIYDVKTARVTQRSEAGNQKILAVGTHPNDDVIVTCGVDHLMFWKVAGTKLKGSRPNVGALGREQTFLCVDFCYLQYQGYGGEYRADGCPGGIVTLTGSADGYIYVWEHNILKKIVNLAHTGPIFDLFVPNTNDAIVHTAGQDGFVRMWNLSDQTAAPHVMLADQRMMAEFCIEDLAKKDKHAKLAPASRLRWSLRNVRSFGDSIFVGTGANEIYELEFQRLKEPGSQSLLYDEYGLHPEPVLIPRTVACGFEAGGCIIAVACHPNKFECVTTSTGGSVRRWDIDWRESSADKSRAPGNLLAALCIKKSAYSSLDCMCVDYTPDGLHLAVGLNDGRLVVVDSERLNLDVKEVESGSRGRVRSLKFSPTKTEGDFVIAVVGESGIIDLVQFTTRRVLASINCEVFAATPSLDWIHDGSMLMTNALRAKATWKLDSGAEIHIVSTDDGLRLEQHLHSWTSITGDAVSGLHAEDGLAVGVTCAQRFLNQKDVPAEIKGRVIVFGDDYGKVNIAAFPCQLDETSVGCSRKIAHEGPVACLAFSYDGNFLVSVGGNDMCMLVWRVVTVPKDSTEFSNDLTSILHKYNVRKGEAGAVSVTKTAGVERGDVFDLVPDYYVGLVCPPRHEKTTAGESTASLSVEQLVLTHCYSYRGFDTRGNGGILRQSRHVVYFTAGLGVVHNVERNSQEFFTKHRANISCLALHPTQDLVATGDLHSSIWVWDASDISHSVDSMDWESGTSVQLKGEITCGIASLCFCDITASGSKLACVGLDGHMVVYAWKLGAKVTEVQTEVENGRHVLDVSGDGRKQLVTSGVDHIKFWTLSGRSLVVTLGTYGQTAGRPQVFLCSQFVDTHTIVTGTQEGSIYVWNTLGVLIHIVKHGAHTGSEIFDICVRPPSVRHAGSAKDNSNDVVAVVSETSNVFYMLRCARKPRGLYLWSLFEYVPVSF